MLNPNKLLRYKDVALLFLRHGNKDLIQQTGFGASSEENVEAAKDASELADDLEKLGPTFVKIGQMLSTRADLLPPIYLDALSRLQDDVEPISYEVASEAFENELGVRVSKAFRSFDEAPLASASLGQVHRAELHDGREVVVKIQRPGIRKEIVKDLDALEGIAEFMDEHTDFGKKYDTALLVAQFRRSLLQELDYQREASQLLELKENLAEFLLLKIPGVVADFTSARVLTMDYLPGNKVTSLSGTVINDVDGQTSRRRTLQGLPTTDSRGWLLSCRPSPRQSASHQGRDHRHSRSRHGWARHPDQSRSAFSPPHRHRGRQREASGPSSDRYWLGEK